MNSDGALDVVTQSVKQKTVLQVFWGLPGDENGITFEAGLAFFSDAGHSGAVIAVGDVNDDEAVDIVVTAEDAHEGQVFLNDATCTSREADPGDANADGCVNLADPIAILAHLFASAYLKCPGVAEVNGDGELNVADPLYILQYLFVEGPPLPAGGPRPCRN